MTINQTVKTGALTVHRFKTRHSIDEDEKGASYWASLAISAVVLAFLAFC